MGRSLPRRSTAMGSPFSSAPRANQRPAAAVVHAAGKGKRMRSSVPKVLHEICGRPCLWHVVRAALAARPVSLSVVVAYERPEFDDAVAGCAVSVVPRFVAQEAPT